MRQETKDFLIGGAKTEKTWDFLLGHEIFSWDRRQEIFSLGGDPILKRHKIFSWVMRFSHETGDKRFSCWGGGPNTEKIWDFLLGSEIFSWDRRQEIFSWGGAKKDKIWDIFLRHEIFFWDMRFSHETGNFFVQPPSWENLRLLSHDKMSCLMRFSCGIYRKSMRHENFSWDRRFF